MPSPIPDAKRCYAVRRPTSRQIISSIGQGQARLQLYEDAPRPVVAYAHDYPGDWATEQHAHPRAQLLYGPGGVMRIAVGRVTETVPPGTGLFVPADVRHALHMDGPVAMSALLLQQDAVLARPTGVIAVTPPLRELILAAYAEPVVWDLHGRGWHLAVLAIDEIARAATLPLSLPMPLDRSLLRVASALPACPADGRDLTAFAEMAGGSGRTLARLFQRDNGMSFQQRRRHLRLTGALAVLAAGGSPAQATAQAANGSLPAIGAAFRATFGATPGAMRQPRA